MDSFIVMSLRLLWIAALSTALPLAAHADDVQPDAAELYHDYCSVCHGDRGDGRSRARQGLIPPPRDFSAPGAAEQMPRERMIDSVLNGRPGTAMVGWKTRLSAQQAAAIVDYIRGNFMRQASAAPAHGSARRESAPVAATAVQAVATLRIPRGNAQRGVALYMANCSTCHGVEGKGNGPRAYFIFPRPRDFTSAEARAKLDSTTLFNAVKEGVPGKEMPAWGRVFSHQQIADVSAFVTRSFLHPATRTP